MLQIHKKKKNINTKSATPKWTPSGSAGSESNAERTQLISSYLHNESTNAWSTKAPLKTIRPLTGGPNGPGSAAFETKKRDF